jgi:hypothetical protein
LRRVLRPPAKVNFVPIPDVLIPDVPISDVLIPDVTIPDVTILEFVAVFFVSGLLLGERVVGDIQPLLITAFLGVCRVEGSFELPELLLELDNLLDGSFVFILGGLASFGEGVRDAVPTGRDAVPESGYRGILGIVGGSLNVKLIDSLVEFLLETDFTLRVNLARLILYAALISEA